LDKVDVPKAVESFLQLWDEHDEIYAAGRPKFEAKFIWGFIEKNREYTVVVHIQHAILMSCPWVKKLEKTVPGRRFPRLIDIGDLKWPQVVDALTKMDFDRLVNDVMKAHVNRRATKKAKSLQQRAATRAKDSSTDSLLME
jgi:hypothetical protein